MSRWTTDGIMSAVAISAGAVAEAEVRDNAKSSTGASAAAMARITVSDDAFWSGRIAGVAPGGEVVGDHSAT
jgi:hypothetical protein